jgi:hypothetical protein
MTIADADAGTACNTAFACTKLGGSVGGNAPISRQLNKIVIALRVRKYFTNFACSLLAEAVALDGVRFSRPAEGDDDVADDTDDDDDDDDDCDGG